LRLELPQPPKGPPLNLAMGDTIKVTSNIFFIVNFWYIEDGESPQTNLQTNPTVIENTIPSFKIYEQTQHEVVE